MELSTSMTIEQKYSIARRQRRSQAQTLIGFTVVLPVVLRLLSCFTGGVQQSILITRVRSLAIMNISTGRHSIILITAVIVILGSILIIHPSSDPSSISSTTFVTAAWASSSVRNQQYQTTAPKLPFTTTTTTFHTPRTQTCWGHTKPSQRQHLYTTYRGGNQDRKNNISALSMADTTAIAETSEEILSLIGSSGLSIENYQLLSDRGKIAIQNLIRYDSEYQDQVHLYQNWPSPGTDDENKIRLCEQVIQFFFHLQGGVLLYLGLQKH
jgi:hypothetical protein